MAEEYNYPEDEFDRLAKERKVLGAHREVQSKRGWWFAVLAIIVIVPLLAWIFVRVGAVDSVTDKVVAPSVTATQTPSDGEQPGAEEKDSDSAKGNSDSEKTEDATAGESDSNTGNQGSVDTAVEVRILNGSRVNGLAATKEETLKSAGFTNTLADNYGGGATPSRSTVFYANEDDAATAEKVASALGIPEIVLSPQSVSGGQGIVVVLRSDAA